MKNSGNEIVLSVIVEMIRSNKVLRYKAAKMPSKTAMGTDISAAMAAKKSVLENRQPINSATGLRLARDIPISPFEKLANQSKYRAWAG